MPKIYAWLEQRNYKSYLIEQLQYLCFSCVLEK